MQIGSGHALMPGQGLRWWMVAGFAAAAALLAPSADAAPGGLRDGGSRAEHSDVRRPIWAPPVQEDRFDHRDLRRVGWDDDHHDHGRGDRVQPGPRPPRVKPPPPVIVVPPCRRGGHGITPC